MHALWFHTCTGAIACTCGCQYVHFKSQPTTSVVWVYRETHIDKQKERRTAYYCDVSIPVCQLSVSCWSGCEWRLKFCFNINSLLLVKVVGLYENNEPLISQSAYTLHYHCITTIVYWMSDLLQVSTESLMNDVITHESY